MMQQRMGPGQQPRENPLYVNFRNTNFPPNLINSDNVLEYFCNPANTFYDMSSCNQQIRMQNINRPMEECLRAMEGIQYVLWSAQPPLFIICKQRRNSANNSYSVTPLAYYYIINGCVHQAPDMYTVVQSRLLGSIEPLKNAFDEIYSYSRYNSAQGYYWEFKNKLQRRGRKEPEKGKPEDKKPEERSTHFQNTRTRMLMEMLFNEMPPGDSLELVEKEEEVEEEPEPEEEPKEDEQPMTMQPHVSMALLEDQANGSALAAMLQADAMMGMGHHNQQQLQHQQLQQQHQHQQLHQHHPGQNMHMQQMQHMQQMHLHQQQQQQHHPHPMLLPPQSMFMDPNQGRKF